MKSILTSLSAGISELKKNPSALIKASEGVPIAILNHNKPTAYLVAAETYERMMEQLEDYRLTQIVKERENEETIDVDVNDL